MLIYIASANKHKIEELQVILGSAGVELKTHPDFAGMHVEETGDTFEENASIKALALSRLGGEYVIADDSGLEVDALDGAPGVYSARYSQEGSDSANNTLLLANMEGVTERAARFVSVIALVKDGEVIGLFRGECEGTVGYAPKGGNGFGYDPLFVLPGGITMAELPPEAKNAVSHRRRAAEQLYDFILEDI